MDVNRRDFLKSGLLAAGSCAIPGSAFAVENNYRYFGRTLGYQDYQIIDPGLKIRRIETFTKNAIGIVRLVTNDGSKGIGQISTYDADMTTLVLHHKIAPKVLGKDPAFIDQLVDTCIERNHKYPWSFVCRALTGVDTAIWDLYGKLKKKSVCELIGGTPRPFPVYGSSMSRDITPEKESDRLKNLRDRFGYQAFKIRVGSVNGHNKDQWPGRTEKLIPTVREGVGDDIRLLVDGNSCYTPDKAIQVGRLLEEYNYAQFEEPCPYWELEWTAEVTRALDMAVSGGEQDNDVAQWRRMINMNAVDIVQPDICYIGGLTRAMRVAKMAQQHNKPCIPHSANISMVTIFTLHMMGAIPNAGDYIEFSIEDQSSIAQQSRALYDPQLRVVDGKVQIPSEPGWGIKINPGWLESAEYKVSEI